MPVVGLVVVICAVALVIGIFAVADILLARRDRGRWEALNDESLSRRAAAAVVDARAQLAAVLDADASLPAERRHPSLGNVGSNTGTSVLDGEREVAREALLDAQRLWESVRPQTDTTARVGLWSGRGWVRAWQFGPIGFERIVVRADHLLDPNCWVLREFRRFRFGFGVGAEAQSIAVFAVGTPSRRLDDLLQAIFSGGELACRPGFAPRRWVALRRRSPVAQAATRAVLADRWIQRAPDPTTTAAVWAAIREDFGDDVTTHGLPGLAGPLAVATTSGPSLLFGGWWGTRPTFRLGAASSHVVWRDER